MHNTLSVRSSDTISHPRSGGVMPRVVLGASLISAAIAAALGSSRTPSNDAWPVVAAVALENAPLATEEQTDGSTSTLEVQPVSFTEPTAETVEPTFPTLADLPDGEIPAGTVVTVMVGDVPVSMSITDKGAVTVLGNRRFVHEVSLPFGWSRIKILKVEKIGSQIITTGSAGGLQNTSERSIDAVTAMVAKALEKGEFGYEVSSFVTTYDGRLREDKTKAQ